MGTSAVRFAIVVALVVGGVAVLANAFPEAGGGLPGDGPMSTTSPSPTGSPTTSPKPTFQPEAPEDIRIAVYNGTFEVGVAGETQQRLETDGFRAAQDAADWPEKPIARTAVYFVEGGQAKADAQFLVQQYFPGARVQRFPSDGPELAPKAEVVILIGEDSIEE